MYQKQEFYGRSYPNAGLAGKVSTLGNPATAVTCSMDVATRVFGSAEICGVSTFEEGAEQVVEEESDYLLVPGAYPEIKWLYRDHRLTAVDAFVYPIAELVFCSRHATTPEYVERVYYHPATDSLLGKLETRFDRTEPVCSNEKAGEMLLQHPGDAAISNMLVANYYGLTIHMMLQPKHQMGWVLFAKN